MWPFLSLAGHGSVLSIGPVQLRPRTVQVEWRASGPCFPPSMCPRDLLGPSPGHNVQVDLAPSPPLLPLRFSRRGTCFPPMVPPDRKGRTEPPRVSPRSSLGPSVNHRVKSLAPEWRAFVREGDLITCGSTERHSWRACFGRALLQARRCRASPRWNSSANEPTPRRCDPCEEKGRLDGDERAKRSVRKVDGKNTCDVDVRMDDGKAAAMPGRSRNEKNAGSADEVLVMPNGRKTLGTRRTTQDPAERANAEQTLSVFASSAEYIPQCQVRCEACDSRGEGDTNEPSRWWDGNE